MISCAYNPECNSGYIQPLLHPAPPGQGGIVLSGQVCPLVCVSVSVQAALSGVHASASYGQVGLGVSATAGYSAGSICNKNDVTIGGSFIVGYGRLR